MLAQNLFVVFICLAPDESDRDDQRQELVVVLVGGIKQAEGSEQPLASSLRA